MEDYNDDTQLSSLAFTKRISRLLLICLNGVAELKAGDEALLAKIKELSNLLTKILDNNQGLPPSIGPELEQLFDELVVQKYLIKKERKSAKELFITFTKTLHELSQSSGEFDVGLTEQIEIIEAAKNITEIRDIREVIITQTRRIQTDTQSMRKELEKSKRTTSELTELLEQVQSKAMIDPLTKVYNRGTYNMEIGKMIKNFERYKEPAALIMIDIDHFKQFNDNYGHQTGDAILTLVASVIKETVRNTDVVFRYGGEEFVVLMNKVAFDNTQRVAEKVREEIESHHLTDKKAVLKVTASLGFSCFKEGDTDATIFERADKALYQGKQNGRNRIEYLL